MKAALDEQGFSAKNFKQNRLVAWEESERAYMEELLNRHGFVREDKNAKYAHQTVEEFKKMQDEKKIISSLRKIKYISDAELSAEHVQQLKTKLLSLERKVETITSKRKEPKRHTKPDHLNSSQKRN